MLLFGIFMFIFISMLAVGITVPRKGAGAGTVPFTLPYTKPVGCCCGWVERVLLFITLRIHLSLLFLLSADARR